MRHARRAFASIVVVLAASACHSAPPTDPIFCTAIFKFGLSVTVVDSVTGVSPASASFVARSGAFVDSIGPLGVIIPPDLTFYSAGERAGVYDLVVHSPGYRDWTQTGVQVTSNVCHVNGTVLTARLQH
jgi:hypothetical protein